MTYCTDNKSILAWHGTKADGTTQQLKFKEIVGVKNVLTGDIILCKNALHGSIKAFDMLSFSEGLWVRRTLHEGLIVHDSDKIGSSERTVVAEADATQVILDWAFWCADRAVHTHAVAALRQAGMDTIVEKLISLQAVTDVKSANAASRAATAVAQTIYATGRTACTKTYAAANAAYAAHTAHDAAIDAVHAFHIAVYATCASSAAYAADAAASAVNGNNTARIVELAFLNSELERRLFALMGITETKGAAK